MKKMKKKGPLPAPVPVKLASASLAVSLSTRSAMAAVGGVEQLSNSLMGPMSGLAHVLHAIAFVGGVAFLLGAILQYKYHRDNPQQVRISTPITLLAIGVALVAMPIITMLSDSGKFIR